MIINVLNDIQLPIYKFVDRLPRKKDSNTIYIKKVKKQYKAYVWLGGKWHTLGKFKRREEK